MWSKHIDRFLAAFGKTNMNKITVKYGDRDPGLADIEIEPSFKAIARHLDCEVDQMLITSFNYRGTDLGRSGVLKVTSPWPTRSTVDRFILISHEDFKKVL